MKSIRLKNSFCVIDKQSFRLVFVIFSFLSSKNATLLDGTIKKKLQIKNMIYFVFQFLF